jgi:transcription initiation factor IIF auxiliary subunit
VLHESFQNPRRDVEMPPYELTETGWGEFDIVVVLHFRVRWPAAGWYMICHPLHCSCRVCLCL